MTQEQFSRLVAESTNRLVKICRSWLARVGLSDHAEDCVSRAWMEFIQPADSPKYLDLDVPTLLSHAASGTRARAGDVVRQYYGISGDLTKHHRSTGWLTILRDVQALERATTHAPDELSNAINDALAQLPARQQALAVAVFLIEDVEPGDRATHIGEDLGMSRRTVFRELDEIRAHLSKCLKGFAPKQKDSDTTGVNANRSADIGGVSEGLAMTVGDTAAGIRDRIKLWRAGRQVR